MSLTVHYICAYYPQWAHREVQGRTQAQWHAYNFCRAVKYGETRATIRLEFVDGSKLVISSTNVHRAREIFGKNAIAMHDKAKMHAEILVPVPSKDSAETSEFRSLAMVRQAFAGRTETPVWGIVRFTEKLEKAAAGGRRDRAFLQSRMAVTRTAPHLGARVVLVDDVVTTGNSLLATKAVLEDAGYQVVAAIACGRTLSTNVPAFKRRSFELSDNDLGYIWD